MILKLKFIWSLATLDVTNSFLETVIFDPKEMLGILDLRLIGYYKIKQGILQKNSSKCYRFESLISHRFESADILCEKFNTYINILKKEKDERKEKYPWLEPDIERQNMSDREILDKYEDLDKSCLSDTEKKQVMDMLYKYKNTFGLRDEIGTCLNIEIEIYITDKSPFFIRPYHVKEEDKNILDKEMNRLCYLGILNKSFSGYFSPVVLISRKVTKDKRVITDFRHLNV